ncbi:hypothetical protein AWENTII_002067 [Aspergillus wentii]
MLPLIVRNADPSQVEHLYDWILVNGTCRRFRNTGKRSFFAHKTFAMTPQFAHRLRYYEVRQFSYEGQEMALRCIQSVVFMQPVHLPSAILKLSERVSLFPRLKRINFVFEGNIEK